MNIIFIVIAQRGSVRPKGDSVMWLQYFWSRDWANVNRTLKVHIKQNYIRSLITLNVETCMWFIYLKVQERRVASVGPRLKIVPLGPCWIRGFPSRKTLWLVKLRSTSNYKQWSTKWQHLVESKIRVKLWLSFWNGISCHFTLPP